VDSQKVFASKNQVSQIENHYFCGMQQKIVITGGPGTGKSTILKVLKTLSYFCLAEISREVILEAREKGIAHLFHTDPLLFSNILLKKRQAQHAEATEKMYDLVFFDRGIPDILAYLNFAKTSPSENFTELNKTYSYHKVFVTPPWKAIYRKDNERFETFEESQEIHQHICHTYAQLGYEVVEIPYGIPSERAEFILQNLLV
jgi:predicted ATPase